MADELCLQLSKYSNATGIPSETINWTHLEATNLFLMLRHKDGDTVDRHLSFRVLHKTAVLESLDVSAYIDDAIRARQGSQQAGVEPNIEQLPIFGISKGVLMALRWRLNDGQSRRVQFRFLNQADCQQIVSILQRRGMEFQQPRPSTARPGTSRSTRPDTANSDARPVTSQASSQANRTSTSSRSGPFQPQTLEAGALSGGPLPRAGNTVRESSMAPPSALQAQPGSITRYFNRDETAAPRDAVPERPSTSQLYRSNTSPFKHTVSHAFPPTHGSTSNVLSSSTNHNSGFTEYHNTHGGTVMPEPAKNVAPSSTMPATTFADSPFAQTPQNIHDTFSALPQSNSFAPRPSTAASATFSDTLEHEVPPVRELPFKRPSSHQSGSSRPSSSASATKPLQPKARSTSVKQSFGLAKPAVPSLQRNASDARPATASPLKRSFDVFQDAPERPQTAVEIARPTQIAPTRPPSMRLPSSRDKEHSSPVTSPGRPMRMSDMLYGRRRTSQHMSRLDSTADARFEPETPPSSDSPANKIATRSLAADNESLVRASMAIKSTGQDAQEVSLAEYAAQSDADRAAAFDEFMVQMLEDHTHSFTILCEDVENCWRKIALGL